MYIRDARPTLEYEVFSELRFICYQGLTFRSRLEVNAVIIRMQSVTYINLNDILLISRWTLCYLYIKIIWSVQQSAFHLIIVIVILKYADKIYCT